MSEGEVKDQVRQFYNQVGWQQVEGGVYQNARYEDLRPVAREYIHRCHLRVNRHLKAEGRFLLDAGSGPVQYVEYLTYSHGYQRRVCLDLSIVALQEARKRLGAHGVYVVADVSRLPFRADAFDGVVSLHTFHHLPLQDQPRAYGEIQRVLAADGSAVIVNGWTESRLMRRSQPWVRLMERLGTWVARRRGKGTPEASTTARAAAKPADPTGTFVRKLDADWLRQEVGSRMPLEIRVWRSVSVRWMRALMHTALAGKYCLRLLYWMEERWPKYFGENGQYPLVIVRKA